MGDHLSPKTKLQSAHLSSVQDLPQELFLDIIDHVLDRAEKSEYYDILYGLMLVCSSWANLIKGSPKFWSLIDKAHPSRIPLVLERSNPLPILIEAHKMGVRPDFDDALFEQSHRWEAALIEQSGSDAQRDLQRRLSDATAPMLKTFQLVGRPGRQPWFHPSEPLFNEQFPKLEVLRLVRWYISFESIIFNNLLTLELGLMNRRKRCPASLFDMLRRCRRLTSLTLMYLNFDGEGDEDEDETTSVIELLHLTRFHIRRLNQTMTDQLMAAIRIPHCAEIIIRNFEGTVLEDFPTQESMPHLVTAFTSVLKAADRIILALEGKTFRFTAYLEKQRTFEFCGEFGVEALEVAATQWGLADRGKVRLEIRVQFEGAGIEPLLNSFRALPNITTILLNCIDGDDVDKILDFLGEPFVGTDGVKRWYCPDLENFLMDGCGGAGGSTDDFLDFLENRYEGEGEHPRRFKYMHITIPDDESIYKKKELRRLYDALKPEGMLSWNPGVPKFTWGIADDEKENAKVSTDLKEDRVFHTIFEAQFDWEEDEDEDSDEDQGNSEDEDEDEGASDAVDDE